MRGDDYLQLAGFILFLLHFKVCSHLLNILNICVPNLSPVYSVGSRFSVDKLEAGGLTYEFVVLMQVRGDYGLN